MPSCSSLFWIRTREHVDRLARASTLQAIRCHNKRASHLEDRQMILAELLGQCQPLTLLSGYFARPGAPEQGRIHPMCSVLVDGGKREGLQPRDPSADRDGRGADLDPIAQDHGPLVGSAENRSEEHTSELQSLMRSSYAVFCLN